MPTLKYFRSEGINTFINPLLQNDGSLIHCVNFNTDPFGAKVKRPGYSTLLGTADGSAVTGLFSFTKNDNSLFLYRTSGSSLFHSVSGTGAWTLSGNGTITPGGNAGYAVLDNTLILGDGVGSTRHSTTGTSFTNTTLAPVAKSFAQYQNRIYAGGTSSTLFYSTTGNAADWALAGTSDSSSLSIPGAGTINSVFVAADRVTTSKTSGIMYKWDGYSLIDVSTKKGPTSPKSVDSTEGYYLYLNRDGITGFGGARPEILSNPIQSQFYNNLGSGVAGGTFSTAAGGIHRWDYYLSIGTVTDGLTGKQLSNDVVKYDFLRNEFLNHKFAHFPTSYHSYVNASGDSKMMFGASDGQVYQLGETDKTDAGTAIESEMIYFVHGGSPEIEKKWNDIHLFFNPGCEARVSVAPANSMTLDRVTWVEIGDVNDGIVHYRFPSGTRSKLLYVKIYDNSAVAPFRYYGMTIDAEKAGEAEKR